MSSRAENPRSLRSERGFTLVEMLVGAMLGVVVTGALFAILDVSIHQSSRIQDRASADQRGRIALENIMQLVQSSCVAPNFTPIEPGSTGTALRLVSQAGAKASITEVTLHELKLTGTTLTDVMYPSEGSAPNWKFPAKPTSERVLIKGVAQVEPKAGETTPMFRYYSYTEAGSLSAEPLKTPLSEESAAKAGALTVTFLAYPENGNITNSRPYEMTDSAVLRFDPSSLTSTSTPCA